MAEDTRPSLDPRKSPWQRGDVVTADFKSSGHVLSWTDKGLEVRWTDQRGVELVRPERADDLLRVAHAADVKPGGPRGETNLEMLEVLLSLERIRQGMSDRLRTVKNQKEKDELDSLIRRAFEGTCAWDKRHQNELIMRVLDPHGVGSAFRIRDGLHRAFCRGAHGQSKSV